MPTHVRADVERALSPGNRCAGGDTLPVHPVVMSVGRRMVVEALGTPPLTLTFD